MVGPSADKTEMLIFILGGIILGLAVGGGIFALLSRWQVRPMGCGRCGYDVRGRENWTCSECGADFHEVGISSALQRNKTFVVALTIGVVICGMCALAGVYLAM